MQTLFGFINDHHVWATTIGFWLLSALVSGMPQPTTGSSVAYVWLYSSLHLLMANLQSLFTKKASELTASTEATPVLVPVVAIAPIATSVVTPVTETKEEAP